MASANAPAAARQPARVGRRRGSIGSDEGRSSRGRELRILEAAESQTSRLCLRVRLAAFDAADAAAAAMAISGRTLRAAAPRPPLAALISGWRRARAQEKGSGRPLRAETASGRRFPQVPSMRVTGLRSRRHPARPAQEQELHKRPAAGSLCECARAGAVAAAAWPRPRKQWPLRRASGPFAPLASAAARLQRRRAADARRTLHWRRFESRAGYVRA